MYPPSQFAGSNRAVRMPLVLDAMLFDLDGTLVDSLPDITAAVNAALRAEGAEPMTLVEVRARLGMGAASILAPALHESDPNSRRVERAARAFVSYYRAHLVRHTKPREGVPEVLAHFSSIPKFVVSNKPSELAREVLEALKLAHHFEGIYGGDSFPRKKPDPLPIRNLLDRHGWAKSRTVMIGDATPDVQAAKAAGIISCAVLGGYAPREALEAEGPDFLLPDMSALPDLFSPGA